VATLQPAASSKTAGGSWNFLQGKIFCEGKKMKNVHFHAKFIYARSVLKQSSLNGGKCCKCVAVESQHTQKSLAIYYAFISAREMHRNSKLRN
jgi:hypothetical protein